MQSDDPAESSAAHMQRQSDMTMMANEELHNRIARLLEDCDTEDLRTIQTMFAIFAGEGGRELIIYWIGYAASLERQRFGSPAGETGSDPSGGFWNGETCPRCSSPDPKKHLVVQYGGRVQLCSDHWHDLIGHPTVDAAFLEEYNLNRQIGQRQVTCRGCGLLYISLEDRMLKPPGIDGCSGCQQRSAQG